MESSSIREITGRGRCVISNRRYEPGDLVQCEEPYAMIVTEAYATVACSYCCALCVEGTMYALSSESPVRYCSEKCITADYPIHVYESQAIAALEEAQIQGGGKNSMRLVFRVGCCRKSEEALKSLKPNNYAVPVSGRDNTFEHVLLLEANTKSVTPEVARDVVRTTAHLSTIARTSNLNLSAVEVRQLLYSIQCNAHLIVANQRGLKAVALGLFPLTSMMNHSCNPNCIHRFLIEQGKPPKLIMRAIQSIEKGEELCYSYVNLYQSTTARRSQLSSAYSFLCICERCLTDKITSFDENSHLEKNIGGEKNTSLFSHDADIDMLEQLVADEITQSKTIEEIEESITKAATAASNAENPEIEIIKQGLQELLTVLSGSDVLRMHPAHRLLFLGYHTYFVSASHVVLQSNLDTHTKSDRDCNTPSTLRRMIGFGLLALGCMKKYVRKVQTEIGYLEGQLTLVIDLLVQELEVSDNIEDVDLGYMDRENGTKSGADQSNVRVNKEDSFSDIIISELCAEKQAESSISVSGIHSPHKIKIQPISDFFLSHGYLNSFPWALKEDQRLAELLNIACLFKSWTSPSEISSNSSSSQSYRSEAADQLFPVDDRNNGGDHTQQHDGNTDAIGDTKRGKAGSVIKEKKIEREILQNLLLKLRESSVAINSICRA